MLILTVTLPGSVVWAAPRKAVCSDCERARPRPLASALAIHYSSAEAPKHPQLCLGLVCRNKTQRPLGRLNSRQAVRRSSFWLRPFIARRGAQQLVWFMLQVPIMVIPHGVHPSESKSHLRKQRD